MTSWHAASPTEPALSMPRTGSKASSFFGLPTNARRGSSSPAGATKSHSRHGCPRLSSRTGTGQRLSAPVSPRRHPSECTVRFGPLSLLEGRSREPDEYDHNVGEAVGHPAIGSITTSGSSKRLSVTVGGQQRCHRAARTRPRRLPTDRPRRAGPRRPGRVVAGYPRHAAACSDRAEPRTGRARRRPRARVARPAAEGCT